MDIESSIPEKKTLMPEHSSWIGQNSFIFHPGQVIPTMDYHRSYFLNVKEGLLKICLRKGSNTRTINICGPGDVVGINVSNEDSHYIITSLTYAKICLFDHNFFQSSENIFGHTDFIQILCRAILIKDEAIFALENTSVKSKVASMLLKFSKKFGQPGVHGIKIDIDIDRKTMAELSGTVIETLSRVLTEFEKNHVILRKGRNLFILNTNYLTELSLNG